MYADMHMSNMKLLLTSVLIKSSENSIAIVCEMETYIIMSCTVLYARFSPDPFHCCLVPRTIDLGS